MSDPELVGMIPDGLRVRQARIKVDSLEVMSDIGFHDFEIGSPQRLLISVELWLNAAHFVAPADDDPTRAWDYDYVVREIRALVGSRRFNLQETLVHALFERLAGARDVRGLRISSRKPDVYPDVAAVGVEIASFEGEAP